MGKITLLPFERETIIDFNDDGDTMKVYTCMRRMITKLDKLVESSPEAWKCIKVDKESGAKTYEANWKLLSFRKPKIQSDRPKRVLSEEHLAKLRNSRKRKNPTE